MDATGGSCEFEKNITTPRGRGKQEDGRMKIVIKETGETIGTVITNHSLDIYEACRLAGLEDAITPDVKGECKYDAERDLEMIY